MAVLTIEIPDDLMEQLAPLKEQLPDLLRRCLHPLALPAQVYRYVLDFFTSQPTSEQIAAFRPTDEMQSRLRYLIEKDGERYSLLVDGEGQRWALTKATGALKKLGNA